MNDPDERPAAVPWRAVAAGVMVRVRATPKASLPGIGAIEETAEGPALAVKVRASADKGAANRAVETTMAEWLDLPRSHVRLVAGPRSRIKSILLEGRAEVLLASLQARLRVVCRSSAPSRGV